MTGSTLAAVRASILASHSFSMDVWSLNARTFAPTQLRVRDLVAASRATFDLDPDQTLEEVCQWHSARIQQVTAAP